jgi:CubicO group peptidase (beta-lactamase class C family)
MNYNDYVFKAEQMPTLCVIDSYDDEHIYGNTQDIYELASVTKILTAITMSELVESGFINFNDKVEDVEYLNGDIELIDLLSHTSGLALNGELPQVEPRSKRVYSNLGMETIDIFIKNKLSKDHNYTSVRDIFNDGFSQIFKEDDKNILEYYGSSAWGAKANIYSMITLARQMRKPTFLSSEMHSKMQEIYLPQLRGVVPGWGNYNHCSFGTGYEIKGDKTKHWMGSLSSEKTFGHYGHAGVFIMHDPVVNISIIALGHKQFDKWAVEMWPNYVDNILKTFN